MGAQNGEKSGYREAMDRTIRNNIQHGMKPDEARRRAREAAVRADRRERSK